MDTEVLVEEALDEGQELIEQLARDGFEVVAAFWVKASEERLWSLYIASPSVEDGKVGDAYGKAYTSLSKLSGQSVSLSDIKLISPSNPLALHAINIRDRRPGMTPMRFHGKRLGEMAVEEVCIYPPLSNRTRRSGGEERRLLKDVKQVERPEDYVLTQEEKAAVVQLMQEGINVTTAEDWVRKRREKMHPRPPIPAGTVVTTWVAAHWGDIPDQDANPLLIAEAVDGARGLVFKEDTEPVGQAASV